MTRIKDILAKNMKSYRIAQGFTQAYLAEKIDTSTNYIGMIEKKQRFPSPEMIDRIAAALGIEPIELFNSEKKLPDAIKANRKAIIKDIRSQLVRFLDEKLADLDK